MVYGLCPVILPAVAQFTREEEVINRARSLLGAKHRAYNRLCLSQKRLKSGECADLSAAVLDKTAVQNDDCAIWDTKEFDLLVTSDMLVENTHFIVENDRRINSLFDAGYKALSVNVSDIAACGGFPIGFVVGLGAPKGVSGDEIDAFTRGLAKARKKYEVEIWGGDLVVSREWTVSITVIGAVDKGRALLRNGAIPGDLIAVSGDIGLAQTGLFISYPKVAGMKSQNGPELKSFPRALRKLRRPEARLEFGRLISQESFATAMIDTSDSIAKSARLIAEASGMSAILDFSDLKIHPEVKKFLTEFGDHIFYGNQMRNRIEGNQLDVRTQFLLNAAEDYELMFTIPPGGLSKLLSLTNTKIAVIGEMRKGKGVRVNFRGKLIAVEESGFEHFG